MLILMVGLDNYWKTTIVSKINGEDTSIFGPTLGFDIKTIAYQKMLGKEGEMPYDTRLLLTIIANKQDTKGDMKPDEIAKESLSDDSMCREKGGLVSQRLLLPPKDWRSIALQCEHIFHRHWQIVGCSGHTGEGLLEGWISWFRIQHLE